MVNRSLTWDELLMMRWLNGRLGESASNIGERLVDRLPNLKPAKLYPSEDALKSFVARWSPIVDQINLRLPDSSQLFCAESIAAEFPDQQLQKSICLLPEQLDCLFEGLMREDM